MGLGKATRLLPRTVLTCVAIICLAGSAWSQATTPQRVKHGAGAPSGSCSVGFYINDTNGDQYECVSSAWVLKVPGTGTPLMAGNNLSDVASPATARTNLGLGSAATQATSAFLQPSNNLSDISNAATARANLGVGTGNGTVTSVTLAVPSDESVSGSPVTSAGTITVSRNTQSANQVLAGPSSGAAAVPAYRALVAADIPALSSLSGAVTSGQLPSSVPLGVTNDTNVMGSVASQGLTLGWSGTLAKGRTLNTTVYTDQANTWTAGAQDFSSAASLKVPLGAGLQATASGQVAYDSTANRLGSGVNGAYKLVVFPDSTDTLTNKTISGASNTLSAIGNSSLSNSSVTVNGTANQINGGGAVSLGGSLTLSLPQSIHTGATPQFAGVGLGTASGAAGLTFQNGTILQDDSANVLALRNGTTGQSLKLYRTYTDASNYERFNVAASSLGVENAFTVGTENAGTGSARAIALSTQGTVRWGVSTGGNLIAQSDNSYPIGASGANRPSSVFIAGPSITAVSGTGITVNDSGEVRRLTYKVTLTYAALAAAAGTADATIATVPAKTRLVAIYADTTTVYSGGSVSAATIQVGKTTGGSEYIVSHDVKTAAVTKGLADADLGTSINRANAVQGGDLPSWTGTTAISVRLTTTGANTNALTQGSTTYYLEAERLP